MITIYDSKTRQKHVLEGLGGPTPTLLIKDHVQHLTDHPMESHQLICNSKLLTDESTVDADIDQVIYVMPILRIEQPTVTNNHIQTLQNIINQIQLNPKALAFLEANLDAKAIPTTLIALLLSTNCRTELLNWEKAERFLRANTCVLKFLETVQGKPGVFSTAPNEMTQMLNELGYPAPPPGARTGPGMGTGLRQGIPGGSGGSAMSRITPEFFQQALSGALRATNHQNGGGGGDQDANMAALQQMIAAAQQQTQGAPQAPQQQQDRAGQLAQLHSMGLMDDVQNVQALEATNGDVNAAVELLFNDME